ncbi:MAG: energy transducer TonB [Candidatus Eisenbacteria bacterium]|uniref:TonB family protein n=1 Tax=Eiseniibacteriota bacterium TaxID=2212470 RepID=A0A956RN88_UNCEI|nr:TonB family protein [Candidatus Eisenbacteria bacterium]
MHQPRHSWSPAIVFTLVAASVLASIGCSEDSPTQSSPLVTCSRWDTLGIGEEYDVPPRPRHMVPAVVNGSPRDLPFEGTANVLLAVGRSGFPCHATIQSSTTVEILENAAIHAALQWEFDPAERDGVPVPCWVVIPFRFSIRDG